MTNRLKEMIIKRAVDQGKGYDLDGDIIPIMDKLYYVNVINYEVEEIK